MNSHLSLRTAAILLALATATPAHAADPPPVPRAVAKRLTTWQRGASAGLTARYRLTRTSSLLFEPLVVHGALRFTAPDRLELRDDERTGATTRVAGDAVAVAANDPALPPGPASAASPARAWLQGHLLALLTARDPEALLRDARVSVPRGPGVQLELSPPRSHPARATIDRMRVRLDPDTGAVLELELVLTSGDRVLLELSDHRPAGPV